LSFSSITQVMSSTRIVLANQAPFLKSIQGFKKQGFEVLCKHLLQY
jgi:hypothetical protein